MLSARPTQLLFRAVNEQIMRLHSAFDVDARVIELLCECGDAACTERLPLPPGAYERLRANGGFVVLPRHSAVS